MVRLAVREDLGEPGDLTTRALVPPEACGRAAVVARGRGVVAGLEGAGTVLHAIDPALGWLAFAEDGQSVAPGDRVAEVAGPTAGMLSAERILLNLLGRLSGIATLTRRYVDAVAGTGARIYDTRKTTPGWRRLEKYAVRCGGGRNHRAGLFEAVLIKDNHLAAGAEAGAGRFTPAEAVQRARRYLAEQAPSPEAREAVVEVEVDTLEQLEQVLPAGPDIVLLDNMGPDALRRAVALRNAIDPRVELEASGGVRCDSVRAIAETGVERISVGALTHSAQVLDLGLDWGKK